MTDRLITLRLVTPSGEAAAVQCGSVQLVMRSDAEGRRGGLVGIRRDHAPAVIALDDGPILASLDGRPVLRAYAAGGYASVRDNVVTVLSDAVRTEKTEE